MTTHEAKADVFAPAKTMPKPLRDAAAILGAGEAPQAAIRDAAETLWVGALTRRSGVGEATVRRSIQAFVLAVFDQPGSEVAPHDAARLAGLRFAAHLKSNREKPTRPKTGGAGTARS